MRKYQSQDYYDVVDKTTGKRVCQCGTLEDAQMMVAFDPENRVYTLNQFLPGQCIDIQVPKELPTNEIVVNMDGGVGGSWKEVEHAGDYQGPLYAPHPELKAEKQKSLPENNDPPIHFRV
jgi:hypothetical protein